MTKPIEYCREITIPRETPYQPFVTLNTEPESSVGWLEAGRVVWLRPTECARAATKISAFAEGVGMIAVRTKYLAGQVGSAAASR